MKGRGMSDSLSVSFAGVSLPNPVILASATPGWDGQRLQHALAAGAGAVVCKTIGPPAEWAAHPRNGRLHIVKVGNKRIGMINLELFTTKSVDDWLERDLAVAKQGGGRLIASVLALPDPADTALLAARVEATGLADFLELNVSCPMPAGTVGMHIGKDASKTHEQVKAVRSKVSLPLLVKMTPNIADIGLVAHACEEAGANGLTVSNSVRSFAGVDIYTGKPILAAFGGYTGPAIKPIVQRLVIETAQSCRLPISAVGGVATWQDVVEYIMLGATTVQVATAEMWNGVEALGKLLQGLERFMGEQGYRSVDEMRGITLPYITTVEEVARQPRKVAVLDQYLCKQCGLCPKVCFYDALHLNEELSIESDSCDGCGLCVELCPVGALRLEDLR